ncbi:undecaprenyl/decaprenyl-phosphate alpha-N-acetylglucosaminyl 1-phosphate transferase, partial [Imbroritus primus]
MFDYFWIPLIAASISATVIFFIRPLALKQGLLDHPGGRKRHEGDIPLVGGIAVTISILVCSLLLI